MKKQLLTLLLVTSFLSPVAAQSFLPEWLNNYSSSASQNVMLGFKVDSAGHSYSFFYCQDTAMFSSITGHYIIKHSPSGQQMWVLQIPGMGYNPGKLCFDGRENLYTCFSTWNGNGADFLLTRIDTSGTIRWQDTIGSPQNTDGGMINDMALDGAENIYLIGTTHSPDKTVSVKCDSSGTIDWIRYYDNIVGGYDRGNAIAADGSGNVYCAIGSMDSTLTYNTVVIKYSPTGQVIWQNRFTDTIQTIPLFIGTFNDTLIYVTGNIIGTSGGWSDYHILQYDSAGNRMWSRFFDAESYYGLSYNTFDTPHGMIITRTGNIAITGDCVNSGMPWFVNIMYDSRGNLKWVGRDFQTAWGRSVAEDPLGHLLFSGEAIDVAGTVIGLSKYDTLGNRLWWTQYAYPGGNGYYRSMVAVDYSGNIFCSSGNLISFAPNSITTFKLGFSTGIADSPILHDHILVYPNPASTSVTFLLSNEMSDAELFVYDGSGRQIWQSNFSGISVSFPAVFYSPGLYFYRIEEANHTVISGKLLIE